MLQKTGNGCHLQMTFQDLVYQLTASDLLQPGMAQDDETSGHMMHGQLKTASVYAGCSVWMISCIPGFAAPSCAIQVMCSCPTCPQSLKQAHQNKHVRRCQPVIGCDPTAGKVSSPESHATTCVGVCYVRSSRHMPKQAVSSG